VHRVFEKVGMMPTLANAENSRRNAASVLFTALCVLLASDSVAAKATFTTFTVDEECGLGLPEVRGINSWGAVVGYCTAGGFVRTSDGTVTAFAVPGAKYTEAFGVNDAGTVTGIFYDNSGAPMVSCVLRTEL
jgi:hypothetical protein